MVPQRPTTALLAACAAGVVFFAGCGSTSLTSTYHDKPFTIDGDPSDWVGLPMYVDRSGVNVAVSHDAEFFYVMVSTTDRSLQSQIRRGGFTVWFDPSGGSSHTLGIRYPIGMPGMPPPDADQDAEDMPPPPGNGNRPSHFSSGRGMQTDMELLGPDDKDRMIVSLVSEKQIQAKMSDATGGLTYELRVPLQHDANHPHGIGIIPGKDIGLSLLTENMEAKAGGPGRGGRGGHEGGQGGMMPSGGDDQGGDGMTPPGGEGQGRGQGHGGGRGRGGMRGERGSGSSSAPIDITLKVVLSK